MARSPLRQKLQLAFITLTLAVLASQTPLAQRPTPDAPALLPMSRQIAIREAWLERRHASLLPLMRKHDVAMWIVVNEEFHDDPLPLVGFDHAGYRLGMGGGYYDATLAFMQHRRSWRKPRLVGIAYECQRAESLPHDPWDMPLDAVLTERQLYRFNGVR